MDLPQVRQKVDFRPLRGLIRRCYSTYVEDVEEGALVVAHPMKGPAPVPVQLGEPVRIEYTVPGAAGASILTHVVRLEERGVPVVVLALPSDKRIDEVQRREFVRLDVSVPLMYTILYWPRDSRRQGETYESRTRDLSAGGAQILCPEHYPVGTQLDMDLELPTEVIHLKAEVRREVDRNHSGGVWVAVRFLAASYDTRETIVRYIFEEERERRRRGLL